MGRFGLPVPFRTVINVFVDLARFGFLTLHSHTRLAAENLFLRKQLALYLERQVKPRRADNATRITLAALSRLVNWRQLLVVVKPDTLIRWHRKGFRLFLRWKSKGPGRPRIPVNLQELIAEMATANRTWGEERIAAELFVKVGIHVSPRTVRRYMRRRDAASSEDRMADVEHLCAESREVLAGMRFLRRSHGHISHRVCVRGP